MKKFISIIAILSLWVGFFSLPISQTGCKSTPEQRTQTVQTLKIVGQSAKTSMDAATQLLKQGSISVAQWQKVATVYDTQWQPTYAIAVNAAHSNLDSIADPELIGIAAQLAALVAEFSNHP